MNYIYNLAQRTKLINYLFDLAKKQEFQKNFLLVKEETSSDYGKPSLTEILETALDHMDDESKRILVNDFKVKTHRLWWQNYYSRSTYYRLKTKATEKFLDFINRN